MTTVENRIVEMKFDNKQFESGAAATLKTLEKLKEKLNFKKSKDSLDDLGKASKKLDFHPLASSVETISSKFTALGIIGVTALQNITNSAINAGKQLVSALTIEPVKMGFAEYETQINAVQTILANTSSKGTTLQQVNAALDELNKYADLTIYNFTEMTRNIGTFTAAGVDLDTSVSAIKGIANLAAVSGSNSMQASTAMYQLSQALAAGTVKLQDWNSVVNAGMGGQVFQDALKETARVHGIAIDDMIEKEGSFRETLQSGWLTSEILTETLAKFTGDLSEEQLRNMGYTEEQTKAIMKMGETANDAATKVKTFTQLFDTLNEAMQSGWTQSWEYIIGDFEEAKESLTQISDMFSDMINASSDARNNVLKEWSELGGRKDLFEGVLAGIKAIFSYIEPIKQGFADIIPPITGQKLADLTKKFREFMESLILSGEKSEQVRRIAQNVAAVFLSLFNAVKALGSGFASIIKSSGLFSGGLLDVLESVTAFARSLVEGINLTNLFSGAVNVAGAGVSVFGKIVSGLITVVTGLGRVLGDLVSGVFTGLGNFAIGAGGMLNSLSDILMYLATTIPKALGTAVKAIIREVGSILDSLNLNLTDLSNFIRETLSNLLLFNIVQFVAGFKKQKEESKGIFATFKEILEGVAELLGGAKEALNAFATSVKANALLKVSVAVGVLAYALYQLAQIPLDQLFVGLGGLAGIMAVFSVTVIGIMKALLSLTSDIKSVVKLAFLASQFRKIAVSILVLSAAVKILADVVKDLAKLSWKELIKGLGGLAGVTIIISAATKSMSGQAGFIKAAASMILLGTAIKIFVSSIKSLSELNLAGLAKGIIGLGITLKILIGALDSLSTGLRIRDAAAIVVLAAGIKILTSSIESMASLSWTGLAKGIIGLTSSMLILGASLKVLNNSVGIKQAASFILLTAAINGLADIIQRLGSMSIKEIAKGILALGSAMIIMMASMKSLSKVEKASASIMLFALSLSLLIAPIKVLGEMKLSSLIKGMVGLVTVIGIVSIALRALSKTSADISLVSKNLLKLGASLLVFGIALTAISIPLRILGTLNPTQLLTSMAALSGVIAGLVFMSKQLEAIKISPSVVIKVALIGVVIAGIGFALSMLGLISTQASMAAAIGLSSTLLSVSAALFILQYIPVSAAIQAVAALAIVIVGISAVIVAMGALAQIPGAKWLASEGGAFLQSIGEAIGRFVGGIAGGAIDAVSDVLPSLGRKLSDFANNAAPFFNIIKGIDDNVTRGVKNLAESFLALSAGNILDTVSGLLGGNSTSLAAFGRQLSEFAPYFKKFADAISGIDAESVNASANAAKALTEFSNNLPKSGGLLQDIMGEGDLADFASKLVPFGESLKAYSDVISGLDPDVVVNSATAAKSLSELANEIPKFGGLIDWVMGTSDLVEFGEKLVPFGESLKAYGEAVDGVNPDAITSSANAAKSLSDVANSLDESGGVVGWFMGDKDFGGFAENVKKLGSGLKGYSDAIGNESYENVEKSVSAVKALSEIGNSLGASGGLGDLFVGNTGNSMSTFSEGLSGLGEGIAAYAKEVATVSDYSGVEPSANALVSLSTIMSGLGTSGGFGDLIGGNTINSMSGFAEGLSGLGEGIASYASKVSTVSDYSGVEPSANALVSLSSAISNLGASGGLGDLLGGSTINSMAGFSENLGGLGEGISSYAGKVTGVSFENVEPSANALVTISTAVSGLGTSGGLGDLFVGNTGNSMAGFADNLSGLGEGIAAYAEKVAAVSDYSNVEPSANALLTLSSISSNIGSEGGMGAWFVGTGTEGISNFSGALGSLGAGIASYADNVSGHDFSSVEASVNAVKQVADLVNSMNEVNTEGIIQFSDTITNLGDMGLTTFNESLTETATTTAENMTTLSNSISNGASMISSAIENLKANLVGKTADFTNIGTDIGNGLINGISGGISSGAGKVTTAMTTLLNATLNSARTATSKFKQVGEQAVSNIVNGINSRKGAVRSAINSLFNVHVDTSGFWSIGWNAVTGFINGMNARRSMAIETARSIARASAEAMKHALDERSPSKVTAKIGEFAGIGLARGLASTETTVKKSSKTIAMAAINKVGEIASLINNALEDSLDMSPTITPVLDMSNINSKSIGKLSYGLPISSVSSKAADALTGATNTTRIIGKLINAADKIQNGSSEPKTVVYVNGATVNDDQAMRTVTKDFLVELARKGAM